MKKKCMDYALDYIYRYPKTEKELRAKLLEKGYTQDEIDNVLIYLKSKKYIDDRQFVSLYVQSELIKKGKSAISIKSKLFQKGVDKNLIKEVFSENEDEISEGIQEKIQKEIVKYKQKGLKGFDIIAKLSMKGYLVDDIKKAIKNS